MGKTVGCSLVVGVAEDTTVGVNFGAGKVASLDGMIVIGKIVCVGGIDVLHALTVMIRTTSRMGLFMVVAAQSNSIA